MEENKALNEFFHAFDERKKIEDKKIGHELRQIEKKRKQLEPIKKLLNQFKELGLIVLDAQIGLDPRVAPGETKKFQFYEGASAPAWGPGVSLFFDHPAEVEIAIPNDVDVAKHGVIVIRSVTTHKDVLMLHQKFQSIEAAKESLARFLGKNAVGIEKDPRKAKTIQEKPSDSVLSNAPTEPPKEN